MHGEALVWAGIPAHVLNIPASLSSGQCFRWTRAAGGDWLGVIADSAVRLRHQDAGFWWQTYPVPGRWELLQRYFALDVDLEPLYAAWTVADPRIGPSLARFAGLRILRQDAEEAFFSFLCASCNTITKITRSVNALAARYGAPLIEIDGQTLFRFPSADRIAEAAEAGLRADLWGYRAPRVIDIAQHVTTQGDRWMESLQTLAYRDAHAELTALYGIGAKIADCICLFALGHDEACPIDTHIRQIAVRLYRPDLKAKTLTPSVYDALAGLFRQRFGPYAGWAQQYLFLDELWKDRTSGQGCS
jgi:N-glycosylase/DNA lyase